MGHPFSSSSAGGDARWWRRAHPAYLAASAAFAGPEHAGDPSALERLGEAALGDLKAWTRV